MTNRQKEIAKQYFDAYPAETVLHVTSDGQVFLSANHADAVNHQTHLKFSDVTANFITLSRKEMEMPTEPDPEEEKVKEVKPKEAKAPQKGAAKKVAEKAAAKKEKKEPEAPPADKDENETDEK